MKKIILLAVVAIITTLSASSQQLVVCCDDGTIVKNTKHIKQKLEPLAVFACDFDKYFLIYSVNDKIASTKINEMSHEEEDSYVLKLSNNAILSFDTKNNIVIFKVSNSLWYKYRIDVVKDE